ncbi:uncharacterized protein LOC134691461 [Mytilus trossulus]|uniref:uncharacterized protein LOC134691461 n=1 Tax=Mytilus trossulus TaxID=6551 RepID=UPI0030044A40
MTKDYLEALVDITKKLKIRPQVDLQRFIINPTGRIRKVSSHAVLDIVADSHGRIRSGSMESTSKSSSAGSLDSPSRVRRISSQSVLAVVQENDSCFHSTCLEACKNMTILEKLQYIRKLQTEIREQDQLLAKQFLQLYKDIQQEKVRKSCIQHQDHLDALFDDTVEEKETPVMCDQPVKRRAKTLTCGVTRMNIRSQRFSCS